MHLMGLLFCSLQLLARVVSGDQVKLNAASVQELIAKLRSLGAANRNIYVALSKDQLLNDRVDLGNRSAVDFRLDFFKGLVVSSKASPVLATMSEMASLTLNSGSFEVYDANGRLLDGSCDGYLRAYFGLDVDQFAAANKTELFRNYTGAFSFGRRIKMFTLGSTLAYRGTICPLLFKDAWADSFYVYSEQSTRLAQNQLRFSTLPDELLNDAIDVNFTVRSVFFICLYRIEMDATHLSQHVFRHTHSVVLEGVVVRIADDLFRSFHRIKSVLIHFENLREFLHASDNIWLTSLNYGLDYDPERWLSDDIHVRGPLYAKYSSVSFRSQIYLFPDEDFCQFQHFPHRQLVLGMVQKQNWTEEKSCTLLYLVRYSIQLIKAVHGLNMYYFYDQDIDRDRVVECDFARRLQLCSNISSTVAKRTVRVNEYDLLYMMQWAELVGPIISFPIISFAGFLLNALAFLVISNKKNQADYFNGGDRIFAYMRMNSAFNLIECLVAVFALLNECLAVNSVYCSSVMAYDSVQFLKIYFFGFFGESMKTCSILAMLAFSLERYVCTVDAKDRFSRCFKAMKLSHFFVFIVLFGFLSSASKIFEFTVADNMYGLDYPMLNILNLNEQPWFEALYAFHYLFNDGVAFVLNFIIDILLVIVVRKDLNLKRQFSRANARSDRDSREKQKEFNKVQNNTNKMILYSFSLYFFCRLPELVLYAYLIQLRNPMRTFSFYLFCMDRSVCVLLQNFVGFLYMISYCANFFFYYKFNRPFRAALRSYLGLKARKM